MRQFARYRHARRVREVSVGELSRVRSHNGPELLVADQQDPANRGQVRQSRVFTEAVRARTPAVRAESAGVT
jgi:hypothetical protein